MDNKKQLLTAAASGLGLWGLYHMVRTRHRMNFKGRTVLITGGSRGLGLVIARQFAHEGARLALLARDGEELERARQHLFDYGSDVMVAACDVRQQNDVRRAIDEVLGQYGSIDVLINNAGVIQVGPMENMRVRDFEDALATHFWGPLYTMMAVVPHMKQRGGGRIVNVSSIGGEIGVPHLVPYCASKFALVGLSDAWRAELAKDRIFVSTIVPGLMRTGSAGNASFKGQHQREFTWFAISDALPGVTVSAENAARHIVEAARLGKPNAIISWPARFAVLLNAISPDTMGLLLEGMNAVLPGAGEGEDAAVKHTGWESQTKLAPSILTFLADRAARFNNEMQQ
jgi:NAD(P)-dependent dehydrogenase (short-subunit alcohol dehydrogenase family)